jgi:hypothetical protein
MIQPQSVPRIFNKTLMSSYFLETHKDLISTVRVGQLPDKIKNSVNPLIKPNFCFHFSTSKFSSRVSGYPQFSRDTLHELAAKITEAPPSSYGHAPALPRSQPSVVTPRAGAAPVGLRFFSVGPTPGLSFFQTFSHTFFSLGHGSLP